MNPPEKYIFNERQFSFYYTHVEMVMSTKPIEAVGLAYPIPTIIARYALLGETYKGYIYEYDGLEIR
jgi:hypothetical protein